MSVHAREAFFLPGPRPPGRFCLLHLPTGPVRGCVLFVPPFAEEMNKSRRMVALTAEHLAANGWAALVLDLTGCGDSGGDFADASWTGWLEDIDAAYAWLGQRFAQTPAVWSLRAGCLLISDWLRTRQVDAPAILWQPVIHGKQHLTQFLFLKAAGDMLNDAGGRAAMARARSDLAAGRQVEVAGYTLSPALATGLEAGSLEDFPPHQAMTTVIEVLATEGASGPNALALQQRWSEAGVRHDWHPVTGPAFWRTQEITVASALPGATLDALNRGLG
ncbi:hydrolase 2, exosortase A system-associated [Denitromonas sp.]|uniref:hydrolase 2, exosortase A system-associated n=1 Tax=Denitromonas sp. TaxID=2734609 RepID=UPI002B0007ED|nr:hydrolase 2, exosortase A system-associated [Denitromonas sp.]